jgi:threonine dehydratase
VPHSAEISLDRIREASERIADYVVRTPIVSSERLNQDVAAELFFKCENLQHVGAFKARGACNAVFSISELEASRGVVAHSSGNHAAALARAARLRNIQAHVVMPENSRPNKIAAVRRYGVEPVFCEPDAASRQAAADRIVEQTGATFIHPYDDPRVINGQGTVGLELHDQLAEVDVVIVPVGGGGLLAGCLTSLKALRPSLEVVAAEPEWADDAHRSWKSGQIELPTRYDTIADGLRTPLGRWTFPIIRDMVDDILLATESQIFQATRQLVDQAKILVEPSAAVPLACVVAHPDRFRNRSVAIVLSGGNIECGEDVLAHT